jgi:peptide/nickel transport system ATP-binding protein
VLICDEVTSSLDVSVQATIVELLAKLIEETGVAMIFVTHHLPLVRSIAHEVSVMSEGQIVEHGLVDEVLENPQADYTKRLLADTPTI